MSETSTEADNNVKYAAVWRTMKELSISVVETNFSGSGDEGSIDDIGPEFISGMIGGDYDSLSEAFRNKMVTLSDLVPPTISLENLIRELSEEILDQPEIPDWYNGEGGNGTIRWIAEQDGNHVIEVTVNVAVVEYDTSTFTYGAVGEEIEEEEKAEEEG